LAYTLIIISIMLTIAATMSIVSIIENKGAGSTDSSMQSLQTADSGVQMAIKKIQANPSGAISAVFGSCSVVDGVAQTIGSDAGLGASSPYTLSFFSDINGTTKITDCNTAVKSIQNIKSVGSYQNTVRAINVAVASGTGGITGGCSVNISSLSVELKWGTGCLDGNPGVSGTYMTVCSSASASGYACGPSAVYQYYGYHTVCICVKQ